MQLTSNKLDFIIVYKIFIIFIYILIKPKIGLMKKILLLLVISVTSVIAQAQIVSTIAGGGLSIPGDGGPATDAALQWPNQIAIDKVGNVYFPDQWAHVVKRIDTSGIITTIAGAGGVGSGGDMGPATAAQLRSPTGIAIDGAGDIYIADYNSDNIRKIDGAGIITTFAGTGLPGPPGDGGPATAAAIISPAYLVFDGAGNLYITTSQLRIRKINTAGIITTFAGTGVAGYSGDGGLATDAKLYPTGQMSVDGAGNVYIADDYNSVIRKVNTAGIISTFAGTGVSGHTGDAGPATAAELYKPGGLCIDPGGNMYIAEETNGQIRKISPSGIISTYAGTGVDGFAGDGGPATAAKFNLILALEADCAGNLFLADGNNYRIRAITVAHKPYYIGESDAVTVCQNSTANPCGSVLQAENPAGVGEPIDWTEDTAPMHGTIAPYSSTVTSGTMTPGLTYTPATGYVGPDSFVVQLDCSQIGKTKKIYVTVNPLPVVSTITGTTDTVCMGHSITLSDATTGGIWSATSTTVSVSSGNVTGVTAGTTTVSYTVTTLGCSTSVTYTMKVKNCNLGVSPVTAASNLSVYPNPVSNVIYVDGVTGSVSYRLLNVMGSVLQSGNLNPSAPKGGLPAYSNNTINVSNVASGVYMLEISNSDGQKTISRIIKQ